MNATNNIESYYVTKSDYLSETKKRYPILHFDDRPSGDGYSREDYPYLTIELVCNACGKVSMDPGYRFTNMSLTMDDFVIEKGWGYTTENKTYEPGVVYCPECIQGTK